MSVHQPLLLIDTSSGQKLNREMLELTDTIHQMDLTNVYRIFYSSTKEYKFFSAPQGTYCKTDHVLGHKVSLSRYKKNEITHFNLSDHHRLKLDTIINKRNNKLTETE